MAYKLYFDNVVKETSSLILKATSIEHGNNQNFRNKNLIVRILKADYQQLNHDTAYKHLWRSCMTHVIKPRGHKKEALDSLRIDLLQTL